MRKSKYMEETPLASGPAELFARLAVDAESHTVVWPNGADIAPEYLYFLAFRDVPELQQQFQEWGYLDSAAVAAPRGRAQ